MQTIAAHLAICLLKKPSESTPAHGAVAAALPHRHHLIICLGVDLIQFVYASNSKLGHGAYPSQKFDFNNCFRRVLVLKQ